MRYSMARTATRRPPLFIFQVKPREFSIAFGGAVSTTRRLNHLLFDDDWKPRPMRLSLIYSSKLSSMRLLHPCASPRRANSTARCDDLLARSFSPGAGSSGSSTSLWTPSSCTVFFARGALTNAPMTRGPTRVALHPDSPCRDVGVARVSCHLDSTCPHVARMVERPDTTCMGVARMVERPDTTCMGVARTGCHLDSPSGGLAERLEGRTTIPPSPSQSPPWFSQNVE